MEKIEVCFEENKACHAKLEQISQSAPDALTWQKFMIIGIVGGLGGMVLEHQLQH